MIHTLEILLLIVLANAAPVIARLVFTNRASTSIDLGFMLQDKQYLFGQTKTWRGLIASLTLTTLIAYLLDYAIVTGLIISISAMLGDLLSSFIKRRLQKQSSTNVLFLDQVPESLFPVLVYSSTVHTLELMEVIVIIIFFIIIELGLSNLLKCSDRLR